VHFRAGNLVGFARKTLFPLLNPRETIQALKQQVKALQEKIGVLEKKLKK